MRELLAAIEAKTKEMRGFLDANDTEKAKECDTAIEALKEQYSLEEKCFKTEQSHVEEPAPAEKELTAAEKSKSAVYAVVLDFSFDLHVFVLESNRYGHFE